jgi:hypothetical protein
MTQPAQQSEIRIPPPNPDAPMVNRVVMKNPFPAKAEAGKPVPSTDEPVLWIISHAHPFIVELKIVRMFVVPGVGIEVYSSSNEGVGVRNLLPWAVVLLCEEVMNLRVFVEEIEDAESDDEEPDDPTAAPDPAAASALTPLPVNGVS